MKTIAIALRATGNSKLTDEMRDRLRDINMDKRLKKAESVKAYLESGEHAVKKELYAARHAEFGEISSIAIADETGVEAISEENPALDLLEDRLEGVERIVVFDAGHCLTFITKRALLVDHRLALRRKLYPDLSDSTETITTIVDIKKAWSGPSREYDSMTLADLIMYLEYPVTVKSHPFVGEVGAEATAILEVYENIKGYLCS